MKNQNVIGVIVIGVLLLSMFFLGRCTKECETIPTTIPVKIPEVKGKFDSPKVLVPIANTETTKIVYEDSIIFVPTVNQELVDNYLKTKEELDRLKLYTDAIKINTYKTNFEDDRIKLTINAKTEGKLLEVVPDYTIKEQNLNIPVNIPVPKEKVFSMNIGAGLSTTKQLDKIEPTVHIDLVNKRGNILSIGYGSEGTIQGKYSIPLFSIKK